MNQELKESLDSFIESCNQTDIPDAHLSSIVKRDLLNFISYLSASDGTISDEEVQFISDYLEQEFSPQDLSDYIEKNNTYSSEFESTLPESLSLLLENEQNNTPSGQITLAKNFVSISERLGKELLSCDGTVSPEELSNYEAYRKMLKSFLEKTTSHQEKISAASEQINDLNIQLEQLNQLIGLDNVKAEVSTLIHLQEIQRIRKERGLKEIPISKHLVFYGNPGTGKTTVARILASIYQTVGVLSKGHLVETDRSGLVAGYIGQTAIKTKKVIDSAIGGVLFIDEAYSLTYSNFENDYGKEAIDTLLKAMEDNRDDLVVIVAGYPDLMQDFVKSNPGLQSRFNKYIDFSDYTPDELMQIFILKCDEAGYTLSDDASKKVAEILTNLYEKRTSNFANGRTVRNLFEKIISNQANRLFGIENLSDAQLRELTFEDANSIKV